MFNYIQELELPVIIVLSKIDRLSKNEVAKAKQYVEKELF
jgi:GTP-binding protein EngB required for normal cell division